MGNINDPRGLVAVRHFRGGYVRLGEYEIASAYNTDIYSGDPVFRNTSTGMLERAAHNQAATAPPVGVFAGCKFVDSGGDIRFLQRWPADQVLMTGSKALALVYDDPGILFRIQADAAIAAGDIGATATILDYATPVNGDNVSGQSRQQLDQSTISGAPTTDFLKIVSLATGEEFATNNDVFVLFHFHELGGTNTTEI